MNERRSDFELLRDFARHGDQPAFAAMVRRHVDLVYATAVRKLEDPGAAEEVSQNVFAGLARKAWQFAPDDSVPAWLYRTTLLEAKSWLRGELRRRRREQTAAELGTTMKTPDEQLAFHALVPLLDEGLLSLREKERTALLLRFYESKSFREVGLLLGVGEDAAQKRVAGALVKLARFFQRRGLRATTASLTAAALEHTAASAPAVIITSVNQVALQVVPPAIGGLVAVMARLAGMTKVQTAILSVAIAAAPVTWQWNKTRQSNAAAGAIQRKVQTARAEQEELTRRITNLRRDSVDLDGRLAIATKNGQELKRSAEKLEILKSRVLGLLTATDYRWPDGLPFVRIPKSALQELKPGQAIDRTGKLEDWAVEVLGMTPEERQRTEQALNQATEDMAQAAAARAHETNYIPRDLQEWAAKGPMKTIVVPPPTAEEIEPVVVRLLDHIDNCLGPERQKLLVGNTISGKNNVYSWFGQSLQPSAEPRMYSVCLNPNHPGGLEYGVYTSTATGSGGGGGVSEDKTSVNLWFLPDAIRRQFFDSWLEEQGIKQKVVEGK